MVDIKNVFAKEFVDTPWEVKVQNEVSQMMECSRDGVTTSMC